MCGIAGFVQTRPELDLGTVDLQLRQLRHRGPDSSGSFARGRGVVGQTRLAVIDLLTGDPPITDEAGAIGVALNGEIYNFAALREELAAAGHQFKTAGDTEVIAHLAEGLEPAALAARLEGMFAFALWDSGAERLILGRDRLGKKPLYYWAGAGTLVFGSEIKAVLAHPLVPRRLNAGIIPTYLALGNAPTPETFFEGIRSVPPGCVLVVERGGSHRIERYWEVRVPGAGTTVVDLSMEDAAREVRRLLTAAVQRRLVADVPLGAFLSGGVDSSAVVGIMAGLTDRPVRTFTIGFEDDAGFDEREYARLVAERFGTEHVEFVVRPDAVDLIERLVAHHDQPFGDSSAVPTYLLSELTRRHVTVALCGDGGDEVFAGYERFAAAQALQRYGRVPAPARRLLRRAADRLPAGLAGGRGKSVQRFLALAGLGLPEAMLAMVAYVPHDARASLVGERADEALGPYLEAWARSEGAGSLDRLSRLNIDTYLLDDLLPKVDRMSMAHGLEVRAPLLDRELVEFGLRLPPALRARGLSLKRVLKAAVSDLLPPEILGRRKRGFGVPLDRWFRTDLRSYTEGMLCAAGARARHHLRPGGVDSLVAAHMSGRLDAGNALWTLLTLEVFLRREDW